MDAVNRTIEPPEETIVGFDWQEGELYGYEEGFVIDDQFIPKEDAVAYLSEEHNIQTAEEYFNRLD